MCAGVVGAGVADDVAALTSQATMASSNRRTVTRRA